MTPISVSDRSLPDRLVVGAMVLAMGPAMPLEARARALLRTAGGKRSALEQALRRIEWGHLNRPSRFAAAASEALRLALSLGCTEAAPDPDATKTQLDGAR